LIKETQAILDAEKKKLEEKQDKTQEEMEALVDVEITYKLTGGGQNAWKDVPVLSADDKQRYTKPVNNSDEILELKLQIQLLKQDKNTIESQANQIESLKQEKTNLELQIKEKDKEFVSLRNDNQSLQRGNSTVQQEIKTKDSKINSLQSENQELKLKINRLEYQLKGKDSKMNTLQNERRIHRTSSLRQTQNIETLNHEKATLEQNKMQAIIEMERLKTSNTSLEQLLKSKEDVMASLNGENKNLSTSNQFIIEMVETQKSLLQAKTNEMELLRQNMELLLANEQRRNDVLEQENQLLKQERTRYQTNVQNTRHLKSNNNIRSTNVGSSHDGDDGNPQNDINYDTELENTEESDDDDTEDVEK
jgi:chromosome segregation ATPase